MEAVASDGEGSPGIQGDADARRNSGAGLWPRAVDRPLASKGPGGARCKLDAGQLRALEAVLEAGRPLAPGLTGAGR